VAQSGLPVDHATSARVRVLGEFWRIYRQRSDFRPAVGRAVLEQAARYRSLLSDPGHFTFATNHGLMENLGLLQLELAFPTLPNGAHYRQLALDRLDLQLSFLIDEAGVVRENSAGYQAYGLRMLSMIFRCMTLLGEPVPATWYQKYVSGLAFLGRLERPDGTLPAFGDTDGAAGDSAFRVTDVDANGASGPLHARASRRPDRELSVHPAAGYWIDWDGTESWPDPAGLSQTVVTWTRPPAPSHKHADELSVILWSKGTSWLTSVGYWPYGEPGRAEAESWAAANALHLANEDPTGLRTPNLLSSGWTPEISVLDLERRGPGAYTARRQVMHLKPDLWVILDHVAADATETNETVWTLAPEVTAWRDATWRDASSASYLLEARDGTTARLTLLGSPGTVARDHRGSRSPFAGWHVVRAVPEPAPAITVEQPAGDAWAVAVLSTASPGSPLSYAGGEPQVTGLSSADAWTIRLPMASGHLTLTRAVAEVTVERAGGAGNATTHLTLDEGPDASAAVSSVRVAFERVATAYPQFQERSPARVKVSLILLGVVLVQEVVLLGVRRIRPRFHAPLRLVSLLCWIGVGVSLHVLLLRSWEVMALS